jgi:hypothetical protein
MVLDTQNIRRDCHDEYRLKGGRRATRESTRIEEGLKYFRDNYSEAHLKEYLDKIISEILPTLRQNAAINDQAITPDEVLSRIYQRLKIWSTDITDLFIYKPHWRKGYNYDAWEAELPNRPLFVNHPFT